MGSLQDSHPTVVDVIEFEAWPKTTRLFKDPMIITEKIDGTNSAVGVREGWIARTVLDPDNRPRGTVIWAEVDGLPYTVYAQSRNRIIYPAGHLHGQAGTDNYGFASWVWANHDELARVLGPGLHYGEWWGQGIGRNYGLTERRFSLFNTNRWRHLDNPEARAAIKPPDALTVVPVLAINQMDTGLVKDTLYLLSKSGSRAAPGFMDPEGICVFLPGVQKTFKVTPDDRSKWELAA
jgi:hypothetical protein